MDDLVNEVARLHHSRVAAEFLDIANDLLHHGGGRLVRDVRLLCTIVWPALYNVLTLQADDPLEVWKLPKKAAIALLPEDELPGREIRGFYERVNGYYLREPSVEAALRVIEQGVRFLEAARFWYEITLGQGEREKDG